MKKYPLNFFFPKAISFMRVQGIAVPKWDGLWKKKLKNKAFQKDFSQKIVELYACK